MSLIRLRDEIGVLLTSGDKRYEDLYLEILDQIDAMLAEKERKHVR